MRQHWAVAMLVVGLAMSFAKVHAADEAEFRVPAFEVPEGYVVELVAGPPLVKYPMMAGFDERGRLFVSESAGQNLNRAELEKTLPNFVRMLEDTDGDGRFDKSTIFADKMVYPMGALWHQGALYLASSGAIWRLQDTNNDGVADRRDMLVSQFGFNGNGCDLHGCFLGPNGRIYFCEGRHGHDIVDKEGETLSKGKAARIFSCRADGSDVKVHCGGGMDNPVEVDFLPEGEMVGTVNIFYQKRGDCLVHWMHGGVYPRTDQPQITSEFRRTGDLLPAIHNYGHTAVSGTCRYRGTHLGADFRDNFFVTEFNTHKVMRTKLTREGSTLRAEVTEFLKAASDDFHPTDVLEDADGSLLVVDTGGWFRNGCPTSQIAKPNILGAIYRVRKKDAAAVADPRGLKIEWSEPDPPHFVDLIASEHFAVRERATARLTRMSGGAAENAVLRALNNGYDKPKDHDHKLNILWTLIRIGSDNTRATIRKALSDPDAGIRQVGAHGAGLLADRPSVDRLVELLTDSSQSVRREAATALGVIGHQDSVPPLLAALKADNDRIMEHALIYALIETNNPELTGDGLMSPSPKVRRGALIALDQMKDGELKQEQVGRLLDSSDAALQSAALDVITRRPGWNDELVELASKLLAEPTLSAEQQALVSGALVAFRKDEKVQALVASSLQDAQLPSASRRVLLDVIGRSGVKPLPAAWVEVLKAALTAKDMAMLPTVVAAIGLTADPQFSEPLLAISRDVTIAPETRLAALGTVVPHGQPLEAVDFALLQGALSEENSPMKRLAAARAFATATLTPAQLAELTKIVAKSGPLEISLLLGAFEKTKDAEIGKALFQALANSPGVNALTLPQFEKLAANFSADVRESAAPVFSKLQAATAQQRSRLEELEKTLEGGNVVAGREIFFGRRTACFACHRVGNEGGLVGPDLSTIGQRRNHRDILEAVLYPSASLVRGYETYSITTQQGKVLSGLITRETVDMLYIRTADQTEMQLPRGDVESMQPSPVSIMPAGLENTMGHEQLRDLMAYLRSLKEGK